MASERFRVESMVRGYHVYKDVWEAAIGEELSCKRELENHQDPFADWAKIAEERHGLNARLQAKSYDCSEGRRPYEYMYNKSIPPSFAERKIRG